MRSSSSRASCSAAASQSSSSSSSCCSTTRPLRILSSVLAVSAAMLPSTSACPTLNLQFQDDTCSSMAEFNTAYQQVYQGLQSYLELRTYNPQAIPQRRHSSSSSAAQQEQQLEHNLLDLAAMATTSYTVVVESLEQEAASTLSLTGRDGNYKLVQGQSSLPSSQSQSLRGVHPSSQSSSQPSSHAHLRGAHLVAEEEDTTASALACDPSSTWCSTVESKFCRKRHVSRRRKLSEVVQTPPSQQEEEESVCEWLLRQDLPACLQGATLLCAQHSTAAATAAWN